jgi:choline dehydrogenase-like flavoprotein
VQQNVLESAEDVEALLEAVVRGYRICVETAAYSAEAAVRDTARSLGSVRVTYDPDVSVDWDALMDLSNRLRTAEDTAYDTCVAEARARLLPIVGVQNYRTGTCRASVRPSAGVVSASSFRVWGCKNVFVCDSSVIPTPLSVPPLATVMALAYRAAEVHALCYPLV